MKNQINSLACILLAFVSQQAIAQVVTPNPAAAFPASELIYPGTSASRAFIATEPYVINIQGTMKTVSLLGKPRSYEFGGDVPFVNPGSTVSDPNVLQGWDPKAKAATNLAGGQIANNGLSDRVTKSNGRLMVRHLQGDGLVGGTGRTSLVTYPVPPRTHVRWDMNVAFGDNSENQWVLTKYDEHPVLFWELKSANSGTPALQAVVDTDPNDATKLRVKMLSKAGKSPVLVLIGQIGGLSRATNIPIVVEAFLDERETADGGKGRVKAWVNNVMIGDLTGPTLTLGPNVHLTNFSTYSYKDTSVVANTRAVFFSQARLLVLP